MSPLTRAYYSVAYAIPDFKTKRLVYCEKDHSCDKNYINKKFDLFYRCLQGVADIKCNLCTVKYNGDKCPENTFANFVKDYLEVVTKCANLGNIDIVIHWLCL